jgi:hypothetical protein
MTALKAFQPTGKKCKWPGCSNAAVKIKVNIKGKRSHCLKHQLYKLSGRVSHGNWERDHYRQHMKSVCAITGTRWIDAYHEVQRMSKVLRVTLSRRETIRRASQQFQVDHIDGNHRNNDPANLQTLTHRAHKFKTDVMGDSNGHRKKK